MDEKRKKQLGKYGAYIIFTLVFLLVIYFIFGEYLGESEQTETGINTEVPEGKEQSYSDSKMENYDRINLSVDADRAFESQMDRDARQIAAAADSDLTGSGVPATSEVQNEALNTLRQTGEVLNDYQSDNQTELEMEYYRQQVERLKDSLNERNIAMHQKDEQIEYYENNLMNMKINGQRVFVSPEQEEAERQNEEAAAYKKRMSSRGASIEAERQTRETVSSLGGIGGEAYAIADEIRAGKRNGGFISAHSRNRAMSEKNTLKVYVARNTVVKPGDFVKLMTLEPARIDDRILLPARTPIVAKAELNGTRLRLTVSSIIYKEEIIRIKMSAYDLNGQEGVYIPESDESDAVKEMGENMTQNLGNSYTFNSSAKDQILTEAAKGVMQGVSRYLTKKVKKTKVLLKSGFEMYLYQDNNF